MKIDLVPCKDAPTGEAGWRLETVRMNEETYASREGRLLAHDLFEHVNGPEHIGDAGDELEALGAAWYVRGQHGGLDRGATFDPVQGLANDLTSMAETCCNDWGRVPSPGPYARRCGVLSPVFDEIIERAKAQTDGAELLPDKLRDYWEACGPRMLAGYRKAHRKYRDADAIYRLFWEVSDAIDEALRHAEDWQTFRLSYCLATGEADVVEVIDGVEADW